MVPSGKSRAELPGLTVLFGLEFFSPFSLWSLSQEMLFGAVRGETPFPCLKWSSRVSVRWTGVAVVVAADAPGCRDREGVSAPSQLPAVPAVPRAERGACWQPALLREAGLLGEEKMLCQPAGAVPSAEQGTNLSVSRPGHLREPQRCHAPRNDSSPSKVAALFPQPELLSSSDIFPFF